MKKVMRMKVSKKLHMTAKKKMCLSMTVSLMIVKIVLERMKKLKAKIRQIMRLKHSLKGQIVTKALTQMRQSMISKGIVMIFMTVMTQISLLMAKELKVIMQEVTKKKTLVKDRAKMRKMRRLVISLRAKMTMKKIVRKTMMMMRLKVKKSVTQWSMK